MILHRHSVRAKVKRLPDRGTNACAAGASGVPVQGPIASSGTRGLIQGPERAADGAQPRLPDRPGRRSASIRPHSTPIARATGGAALVQPVFRSPARIPERTQCGRVRAPRRQAKNAKGYHAQDIDLPGFWRLRAARTSTTPGQMPNGTNATRFCGMQEVANPVGHQGQVPLGPRVNRLSAPYGFAAFSLPTFLRHSKGYS